MESINALGEIVMSTGAVLGTRQMARYYKQRPRPAETRESVLISAMVQVRSACVCLRASGRNACIAIALKLFDTPSIRLCALCSKLNLYRCLRYSSLNTSKEFPLLFFIVVQLLTSL